MPGLIPGDELGLGAAAPPTTAHGHGGADPGTASLLLAVEKPSPNEAFYCHVASYCTQHKTGNAVEQITKFLGVLSPSFCLASCLTNGDIADKVYDSICDFLDRKSKYGGERPRVAGFHCR